MVKATRKCIGQHSTGDISQDLSLIPIVLGFHLPHQEQELAPSQKAFWSALETVNYFSPLCSSGQVSSRTWQGPFILTSVKPSGSDKLVARKGGGNWSRTGANLVIMRNRDF